jgi:hypothetical protein
VVWLVEVVHILSDLPLFSPSQGKGSLGLMWWLLCREVLRLRGTISRELPWEIMPDLFFYRDPEEVMGQGVWPLKEVIG